MGLASPLAIALGVPDAGLISVPVAATLGTNLAMDVCLDGVVAVLSGESYDWSAVKSSVGWSVVITVGTLGAGAVVTKGWWILKIRMLLRHPEATARVARLLQAAGEMARNVAEAAKERGVKILELTAERFREGLVRSWSWSEESEDRMRSTRRLVWPCVTRIQQPVLPADQRLNSLKRR